MPVLHPFGVGVAIGIESARSCVSVWRWGNPCGAPRVSPEVPSCCSHRNRHGGGSVRARTSALMSPCAWW